MARFFKKRNHYYAEWRDSNRHPRRKTVALGTTSKRVAQREFERLCMLYAKGEYDPWRNKRPENNLALVEAVDRFIESRRRKRCTEKTIKVYRETLRLLEQAMPPQSLLKHVEGSHLEALLEKETLSKTTRNSYYRRLSTFFRWCSEQKLIASNPMESVYEYKAPRQEAMFLDVEQARTLLECIEAEAGNGKKRGDMQWLADFVQFALYTGMRRGEIINLRWDAVDLKNGFVVVRNTEQFRTKSGHERRIPLVSEALELLQRLASERTSTRSTDYVFTNERGESLYAPYVSKRFRDYRRKAGLPEGISVHTLRHTTASWLVMKGVSLRIVQEILGHSSYVVTQRYAHLAPEGLKGEMERALGSLKVKEPSVFYGVLHFGDSDELVGEVDMAA